VRKNSDTITVIDLGTWRHTAQSEIESGKCRGCAILIEDRPRSSIGGSVTLAKTGIHYRVGSVSASQGYGCASPISGCLTEAASRNFQELSIVANATASPEG
jgi:hypothetical protein